MKNYPKEYQEQKVNFIFSMLGICFDGNTEKDANLYIEEYYDKANNVYWDKIEENIGLSIEYRFITKKQEKEIERFTKKYNIKFNGTQYEHALLFIAQNKKREEQENSRDKMQALIPSKKQLEFIKILERKWNRVFYGKTMLDAHFFIQEIIEEKEDNIKEELISQVVKKHKYKLKKEYNDIIKIATSKYNKKIFKVHSYGNQIINIEDKNNEESF